MKSNKITSRFLYLLVAMGITMSVTSCYVERQPVVKKTVVVKQKKAHPHGGPPGQTKKSSGHPGKRH